VDKTELDEIRDYTARECLTDSEWAALLSLAYEAVAAQERINGWKREFEKVQAKRDAYRERAEAAEAEATKLREALEELVEAHDYWFSTGMGEARAIAATVKAKGVLG
jgi:biopolymer transport protein ExbB/TolQ